MSKYHIEIDDSSGFCFGGDNGRPSRKQRRNWQKATTEALYCLGDIVHNGIEVERLHRQGLITINHEQLEKPELHHAKVLFRAHGRTARNL